PTAVRTRMNVNRKGRDTEPVLAAACWVLGAPSLFQLFNDLFRLSSFGGHWIDGNYFFQHLDGGVFIALVERDERQLEHRFAPRRILVDRLLVPRRRFVALAFR